MSTSSVPTPKRPCVSGLRTTIAGWDRSPTQARSPLEWAEKGVLIELFWHHLHPAPRWVGAALRGRPFFACVGPTTSSTVRVSGSSVSEFPTRGYSKGLARNEMNIGCLLTRLAVL